MTFLSTAELQRFADFATGYFLSDTCDILDMGTAWNAQGGNDAPYAVTQTGVACAVISQNATQVFSEDDTTGKAMFLILLPKGTAVKTRSRIHVNGSIYYEVIDALEPSTNEVVRRVTAQRFGQGAS